MIGDDKAFRRARRAHRIDAERRDLVRRTTAMTDALVAACTNAGIDVSAARLPLKREPSWRVSRKA